MIYLALAALGLYALYELVGLAVTAVGFTPLIALTLTLGVGSLVWRGLAQ